eukprot:jgi/Botrbrau1/12267/Bobra.0323s0007.1
MSLPQYGLKQYWEERYQSPSACEWYYGFSGSLREVITSCIPRAARILQVGVGHIVAAVGHGGAGWLPRHYQRGLLHASNRVFAGSAQQRSPVDLPGCRLQGHADV